MIKLFSLNIEGDKHIDKIIPFLQRGKPDVVCFQEVFEVDLPVFEKALEMKAYFTPTLDIQDTNPYLPPKGVWGLAIFSNQKTASLSNYYYVGEQLKIPRFIKENPNSSSRVVSWVTFELNSKIYTVATTHFTWSPKGDATEEQQDNMEKLLAQLKLIEPVIVCGDFNAPRGRAIFKMLGDVYTDNIPKNITTTIDPTLHRDGDIGFVVDGLFTTPQYIVKEIHIVGSLSDHKGICATII